MEMRAIENIAVGEDLTPPLSPIASVLHDSAVSSHCSACFSTLPPQPFPSSAPTFPQNSRYVPVYAPAPLYCSSHCSSTDSPLHFSSAEPHLLSLLNQSPPSTWNDSSDLRLSLRLAHIFRKCDQRSNLGGKKDCPFRENGNSECPDDFLENTERIAGLMTNRERLVFGENGNNCGSCEDSGENTENVLERIKDGAGMMAKARQMCEGEDVNVEKHENFALEEMVLCLVLTNAVEVQDKSGSSIGIAVYDTRFSWINHSCSPNACYRFSVGLEHNEQPPLRITPAANCGCLNGDGNGLIEDRNGYGPRVIVRSIKAVNKREEVTIAYTDLLQPKEIRQAELRLKYRFSCGCKRCAAVPTTYVDYALEALSADHPDSDNEIERLMQNFDDAITDYLSYGDPNSCCTKLENLLSEPKEVKWLHPFHHLSLNAYTTLASAYKVQAGDLSALDYRHKLEAFHLYRTSTAYSLLLAGATHHLFMFEPSLVTTVANFWMNTGESLLNLATSSSWDSFLKQEPLHLELSSFLSLKCNDCRLTENSEPNPVRPDQKMQLEEMRIQLYKCIVNITPKVWSLLASESGFLRLIQNPVDFSWLASPVIPDIESHLAKSVGKGSSQLEAEEYGDEFRMNLILLSIHCLRYGALLSSICNGLSAEMNYY